MFYVVIVTAICLAACETNSLPESPTESSNAFANLKMVVEMQGREIKLFQERVKILEEREKHFLEEMKTTNLQNRNDTGIMHGRFNREIGK